MTGDPLLDALTVRSLEIRTLTQLAKALDNYDYPTCSKLAQVLDLGARALIAIESGGDPSEHLTAITEITKDL